MKELMIACSMLEDEVNLALKESGRSLPVLWMARGLHERPERLRAALQEAINRAEAETVLLAFGLCGNALDGLESGGKRLVAPRFHDCVRMLLCAEPGLQATLPPDSLYFTDGWFRSQESLANQFRRCCGHWGEQSARRAYAALLRHYSALTLVDTGAFSLPEARERAGEAAALFGLEAKEATGSIRALRKLIAGHWDREFVIVGPGGRFSRRDFLLEP